MIRLRVSTLEEYRRLVMTDFGSESELVDRLRRGQWVDGPSNWQMDGGTAWHAVLAHPIRYSHIGFHDDGTPHTYFAVDGWQFDHEAVKVAVKSRGPGLHEVTGRKVYTAGGTPVQVQGTCDHIRGLFIRDAKTKFSTPDARDYEHSLQWRFYLDLFDAQCFTYDLFDFAKPKGAEWKKWEDQGGEYKGWKCPGGYCRLKDIVSFRFWRYDGMETELTDWINRFLGWASDRKLLPLLEPRRAA